MLIESILGYRDIIELKTAKPDILRQTSKEAASGVSHWAFTSDVAAAIGQCCRYLDVLAKSDSHSYCHPNATIVIGKTRHFTPEMKAALAGLNARLHKISVVSYDHLLVQARQTLKVLEELREPKSVTRVGDIQEGVH